jgi:hypothetical protein
MKSVDRQIISSVEVERNSYRLDPSYYNKRSKKATLHLVSLGIDLKKIEELDGFNEIYLPTRFTRKYLDDLDSGMPMLGTSSMLRSKLPTTIRIAINEEEKSKLMIKERDILISRSGTIGTSVLCGNSYTDYVASDDCLRLRVNSEIAGYLSAYLKSPIGLDLLQKDGHGKVIRHLKEENILNFILPIIDAPKLRMINKLMIDSMKLIDEARESFNLVENIISNSIHEKMNVSDHKLENESKAENVLFGSHQLIKQRLDPHYHSKKIDKLRKWAVSGDHSFLGNIADVWGAGRFTRHTAQNGHGVPLYSSADVLRSIITPSTYLSAERNQKNIKECMVNKNTILVSCSGKFGGILGRCTKVGDKLDGQAVTQHLMRINTTDTSFDNDYVTGLLSSGFFGYPLITASRFGKDVPEIDANGLNSIPIPQLEEEEIKCISKHTKLAYYNLEIANKKEDEAQKELLTALNWAEDYL